MRPSRWKHVFSPSSQLSSQIMMLFFAVERKKKREKDGEETFRKAPASHCPEVNSLKVHKNSDAKKSSSMPPLCDKKKGTVKNKSDLCLSTDDSNESKSQTIKNL